jgi:hypothetical protein
MHSLARFARARGLLNPAEVKVTELTNLRNRVVHQDDAVVTAESANRYAALALPACQVPTGSSPYTSLSVNSSIMLRSHGSIVSIRATRARPASRTGNPPAGDDVRRIGVPNAAEY